MMFIDLIVAVVVFVYDTLVKLVALSTPIMAVLSFPLASSIVDSVYAMVDQDDTSRIQFELKRLANGWLYYCSLLLSGFLLVRF